MAPTLRAPDTASGGGRTEGASPRLQLPFQHTGSILQIPVRNPWRRQRSGRDRGQPAVWCSPDPAGHAETGRGGSSSAQSGRWASESSNGLLSPGCDQPPPGGQTPRAEQNGPFWCRSVLLAQPRAATGREQRLRGPGPLPGKQDSVSEAGLSPRLGSGCGLQQEEPTCRRCAHQWSPRGMPCGWVSCRGPCGGPRSAHRSPRRTPGRGPARAHETGPREPSRPALNNARGGRCKNSAR